jgi:hypothetical protein
VSDRGEIRSLSRVDSLGRSHEGRVLGHLVKNWQRPYRHVTLSDGARRENIRVHKAVLLAFHGLRPDAAVGRHLDGDLTNNEASNLAWGTQSENIRDAVRHGTHPESRKTHCPQGHLLVEPNLVCSQLKVGKRKCRSCGLALTYSRRTGQPFHELAHAYYERVMKEAA